MVRRSALPLVVFAAVFAATLPGCGDNYVGPPECVSDDECLSPRVCFAGACTDPDGVDTGTDSGDVGPDTADVIDDVTLPDVPPPRLCLSTDPGVIDFGAIEVGEVTRRSVSIENCGRAPVEVTDAVVPDRTGTFAVEQPGAFVLEPGEARRVVVSARGSFEGVFNNDLIVIGAGETEARTALSVTVGEAIESTCVRVAPVTDFGAVPVGESTEGRVFVTNCGTTEVTIESVDVAGPDAAAFAVVDTTSLVGIPPETTAAATVVFTADASRAYEATLQVVDVTGTADDGVLFGLGDAIAPAGCILTSTDLVDFGDRLVGERGAALVTVTNCSDVAELVLREPSLTGDRDRFSFDGVEPILPPGASFELTVSTDAAAVGDWSAALRLDAEDGRTAPAIIDLQVSVDSPPDACLTFEPARVDLGRVPIDGSRTGVATLVNCGDLELALSNVAFEGADTFGLVDDFPDLIGPGERVPFEFIAFGTDPLGPRAGRFEVGDPGLATASVSLTAEIVEDSGDRCLTVDPTSLNFGDVPVGSVATEAVVVVNCGMTDEFIVGALVDAGPFAARVRPQVVPAGGEVLVEVTFAPTSDGRFSRPWRLQSDDGTLWGPWSFAGAGTRTGEACLTFEPPVFSFGERPYSEGVAFDGSVALVNCGESPIVVDSIERASGRGFEVLPVAPVDLVPGEAIEVPVFFVPGAPGRFAAEWVAVGFSPEGIGLEATLSLDGIANEASDICVRATPDALDFDEVPSGSSRTRTTVIENCGTEPLPLLSFGVDGPTFSAPLTLPPVLAPGARAEVPVTLRAEEPGEYEGTLIVVFEPGVSVEVRLFGVVREGARGPWIRVEPTELDFGTLPTGTAVARNVRVCNEGDETLRIFELFLEDGDPGTWVVDPPADISLTPGRCTTFTVRFAPSGIPRGERVVFDGIVSIVSNANNLPTANVSLRGVGRGEDAPLEPCLEPLDAIGRGEAPVGAPGLIEVRYRNCGDVALRITDLELSRPSGAGLFWEVIDTSVEPGGSLAPGATMFVAIEFSAMIEGIYRGTLTVDTDRLTPVSVPVEAIVDEAGEACFRAETEFVDLGELIEGDVFEVPLFFVNCGDVPIRLGEAFAETTPGFAADVETPWIPGELLMPGEVIDVFVLIEAVRAGDAEAFIFVETDVTGAEVVIRGTVFGDEPTPCIELDPRSVNFGLVDAGESLTRDVVVRNCGDVPLEVFDASFRRGIVGFVIDTTRPRVPAVLDPGGDLTIRTRFNATAEGTFVDDLVVRSNDPDRPALTARFAATVTEDTVCPDAVAGVSRSLTGPFAPALGTIAGTRLYLDPGLGGGVDGRVIWEVVDAPGPEPEFEDTAVNGRVSFVPTALGDYSFRVFWELDDGCTGEGFVTVDVARDSGVGEGLRIVATWRTPGDPDELEDPGTDVDLHLARVTPRGLRWNSNQDCYYSNRSPAWGGDGYTGNDPRLLRDELDGLGPEIIVLEDPNESYYVGIYYFSDSGFGASQVTVRFYFDGIEFASATRNMERTGRFWLAAAVEDGGSVRLLDRPNDNGFTPAGVMP